MSAVSNLLLCDLDAVIDTALKQCVTKRSGTIGVRAFPDSEIGVVLGQADVLIEARNTGLRPGGSMAGGFATKALDDRTHVGRCCPAATTDQRQAKFFDELLVRSG
ncbi:unannotated protein [freshwater metagenome]|uniref:Unannotated protein n=1 Tax=freshwater metagenome TaxID=449393 RepID=A0A6J6EUH4_9ZZZZ